MNIYFDTEFTGLHKATTLISLGMIADNGETFYAEFNDFETSQCNDWIRENVLANTYNLSTSIDKAAAWDAGIADRQVYGDKNEVKEALLDWFNTFDEITLVSDCCHYDMMLLIDLFGSAFDLPDNVCPACYDINQDIASAFTDNDMKAAFNLNRERLVSVETNNKHNALHDAIIIKVIYTMLHVEMERV